MATHYKKNSLRMRDDSLPSPAPSFVFTAVFDKLKRLS